ncbi:MAG TPA: sugar phosphate isomerase/epimerase, partial [Devosia sp.]|nr:sugar phosphate isomerase/epimerase [Devosia sp.]
ASDDPVEIARAHTRFGYRSAYCPETDLADKDRIKAIVKAFADEDIMIAEVAIWRNVSAPEPDVRKTNLDFAIDRLALADEVGAKCAVTFIGTLAPNSLYGPHPDNLNQIGFDVFVETARKVVDAVKPKRAKFAFEMMQWTLPDSPEVLLELIHAIDRPAFAAHLDPTNLVVSPRLYYNTGDIIRRCFSVLGPHIVSAHAKDLVIGDQLSLHLSEVSPGTGGLDYVTYLTELDKLGGRVPLLLEHLETEQYPAARDKVKSIGASLGIDI